jgi:hypothetical protein
VLLALRFSLELQNLKEEYEADNQGWRQSIAEKAKRELTKQEQELRSQVKAERDAQIELVRRMTLALCIASLRAPI